MNTNMQQRTDPKSEPAALSKLTEPENAYIGKHVERAQIYCYLLALELRGDPAYKDVITDEYVKDIYYAAALHDVGKNCVPSEILLKPGRLDFAEYEIVKTHASRGERMLTKIFSNYSPSDFARLSIEMAGSHHERWDGSGYPEGLYGLDIPLSARIMALVDVYDALRSKLPYKEAISHEESARIIKEGGGVDFDPAIVKAFSNIESKFADIYEVMK